MHFHATSRQFSTAEGLSPTPTPLTNQLQNESPGGTLPSNNITLLGLTQQVHSKMVLSDVLEQSGEDGQQSHGGVVDVLRHAFHLRARVRELPQLQVLERLLQVLCGVLEERPQADPHHL